MSTPSSPSRIDYSDEVRAFAQRLYRLRTARRLSQSEVARRAGISRPYYTRIEGLKLEYNGLPPIDTIDKLAAAFGVTRAELLGSTVEQSQAEATRLAAEAAEAVQRAVADLQRLEGTRLSGGVAVRVIGSVPGEYQDVKGVEAIDDDMIAVPETWLAGLRITDVYALRVKNGSYNRLELRDGDLLVFTIYHAQTLEPDDILHVESAGMSTLALGNIGSRSGDRIAGILVGMQRPPKRHRS